MNDFRLHCMGFVSYVLSISNSTRNQLHCSMDLYQSKYFHQYLCAD
uniref:Uncharacterized protein n=1 Tax=Anguilla anguilla TaxID=7936 RepID=A0A0E9PFA5_ANGAN